MPVDIALGEPMSTLPTIDAPNGAYCERALDPRRTALLNIDMQNGQFNADILAHAWQRRL